MSHPVRFGLRAVLLLLAAGGIFSGCSTNDEKTSGTADAAVRATTGDGAAAARTPESVFDSGVVAEGDYCSFLVAAECDGNEDCPTGQTCCGMRDGGALRYNSIKCQEKCDSAAGGTQLCHAGEPCPGEEDSGTPDADAASLPSCHRSLILPSYLAVCGVPNPLLPNTLIERPAEAHAVNCGESVTCSEGTKCCVLGNWKAETQATTIRSGYCAPMAEECDCTKAGDAG